MKTTANEYQVVFQNGDMIHAVVGDTRAVTQEYENEENPIAQISRTRTGLAVLFEPPPVPAPFKTEVSPAGAVSAGCQATPTAFQTFAGNTVVFQALPGAGYQFTGWYRGTAELSTDPIAELEITAPAEGETETVYEARFAPI
jgi:hypothetical protein